MTTLFFSNADYYKNEEFQILMRTWNTVSSKTDDPEILEELCRIVKFDFYRKAKEWLFSVDNGNIPNYDSMAWRVGLE